MYRLFSAVAASVLCLTLAAGCGRNTPAGESSQAAAGESTGSLTAQSLETGASIQTSSQPEESEGSKSASRTSGAAVTTTTSRRTEQSAVPTTSKPAVKNLGGRVFKYGAGWSEPKEGSGTSADNYWETKRYVENTYNCKIQHVTVVNDDVNALKSSILAGAPNCDWFNAVENVFQWAKDKCLYPLNELKTLNLQDPKWSQQVIDYSTVDGKTYGIRENEIEFRSLLLYNKSLIKGGDDLLALQKSNALTWGKIFDIAQKVTSGDTYGISGSMDINDLVTVLIAANGGKAVSRGKGFDFTYTFDSANTRNALKTVQDWYKAKVILPTSGMTYLYAQNQFAKGKLGMIVADAWQVDFIYEKAKFDVGIVLFPAGPDAKSPLVDQTITSMSCISSTTESPEDVALIIDAMASYTPSKAVSWRDEWSDRLNDADSLATIEEYVRRVESGDYFLDYRPVIAGDIYSNGVYDLLARVAYGNETPQSFLESIEPVFKKAISDFQK